MDPGWFFFNTSSDFTLKDLYSVILNDIKLKLTYLKNFIYDKKCPIYFLLASEDVLELISTQKKEIRDLGNSDCLNKSTLDDTIYTKNTNKPYTLIKPSNLSACFYDIYFDFNINIREISQESIDANFLLDLILTKLKTCELFDNVKICIFIMFFLQKIGLKMENPIIISLFYHDNFTFCYPFAYEVQYKNSDSELMKKFKDCMPDTHILPKKGLTRLVKSFKNSLHDFFFEEIKKFSPKKPTDELNFLSIEEIEFFFIYFPSFFIENIRFSRIMSIIFAFFCIQNQTIFKYIAIKYLKLYDLKPKFFKIINFVQYNAAVEKLKSHIFLLLKNKKKVKDYSVEEFLIKKQKLNID